MWWSQRRIGESQIAHDDMTAWSDPLAVLRRKWGTVPSGNDVRQDSTALLDLSDADLLAHWERAYRHDHDDLNIRGWYHELYRSFMSGKKLLDVGCGLGLSTIPFAEMGAAITFTDIVPSNVAVVQRVCQLKGIDARFVVIDAFSTFDTLDRNYDVVAALGSLINAPLPVIRDEVTHIKSCLKSGGRWLHFAYPKARWQREGSEPFSKWGEKTDGPGTPWMEWHDVEKVRSLFAPTSVEVLFECEWHNSDFNWFDLRIG